MTGHRPPGVFRRAASAGAAGALALLGVTALPAADSVSFVANHDTERNDLRVSRKDGDTYKLANLFQLAYKRSTPMVYASWN